MKSYPALSALLSCLVFCSSPLTAEGIIVSLTWPECVSAAGQNNPQLLSFQRSYEASQADYRGSFNGLFPSINLSNSYSKSDLPGDGTWNAGGSVSMDLFNLRSHADIMSASSALDRASAELWSTSSQVRFDLRQAFVNLLFSQDQLAVSKKIVDLRKRNADLVSLKYDSGRESKGNMLQSKAELTEAQVNMAEAYRYLRVTQHELNRQIGQDQYMVVAASGVLTAPAMPETFDLQSVADQHPNVRISRASLAGSEAQLKSARSSYWPTLSANYARTFQDDNYFPGGAHWNASGILSYPLFGSGLTASFYEIASAKQTLEQSRQNLRTAQLRVLNDLETAWAALAGGIDQTRVQNQFLEAARQRNSEATVRYSSGLMSYENWENVVSDLVNFERSALRAERDAMTAEASWNLALGKMLEEK